MGYKKWLSFIVGFTVLVMVISSCSEKDDDQALAQKVKSLRERVNELKPGFGDVMVGIQTHHAKLWFAGINQNWELADFELHEIEENVEKIKNLYPEDERTKDLSTLDPALDSLSIAIEEKKVERFRNSFSFLTNSCNNCHQKNGYAFNVITIPDHPPVPNQKFDLGN